MLSWFHITTAQGLLINFKINCNNFDIILEEQNDKYFDKFKISKHG